MIYSKIPLWSPCIAVSRTDLERSTTEGDSPVDKNAYVSIIVLPSTMEHEKFCGNQPRPLGKAKYSLMTDSGQVP